LGSTVDRTGSYIIERPDLGYGGDPLTELIQATCSEKRADFWIVSFPLTQGGAACDPKIRKKRRKGSQGGSISGKLTFRMKDIKTQAPSSGSTKGKKDGGLLVRKCR